MTARVAANDDHQQTQQQPQQGWRQMANAHEIELGARRDGDQIVQRGFYLASGDCAFRADDYKKGSEVEGTVKSAAFSSFRFRVASTLGFARFVPSMDEDSLRSVSRQQTQELAIDVFSNSIPNVSAGRDRHCHAVFDIQCQSE